MRVFVDASAWVAFQIPRDQHARRLAEVMRVLVGHDVHLVTTNWTLYEALALASRWGHRHAIALHRRASPAAVAVDASTEAEALRRFLAWQDKTASVVDHANLLVALDARCDAILSFDDDFAPLARQARVELLR